MAESVVSLLSRSLGYLLMQESELLGGTASQVCKIQAELERIRGFLKDADTKQDESESVRKWVAEIRHLAYNAEEIIETYILKAKYASFFNPKKYIQLHNIGKRIETLQSNIQDITRSVETYGFRRTDQEAGTSSTSEMRQQLRQSYPHYDDEDVIGIDDNIKVLVAELINKEGPHLVSIIGMGGLGKTTLAKKVYNHDDVKRHFDCYTWSFISQQVQVRTILLGIMRKVCNPNEETGLEMLDNIELKEKLYKLLKNKCYLVVLDDIWRKEAWDVLKSAFPKGKMGSKIILTTRIKDVALYVDPWGFHHEPMCLTEEQSWELFCKKALPKTVASTSSSSSSSSSYPLEPEKEKLGRDMIKKCGGLPLAVVVLGGLLAMKKSIHEWEMVAKDIGRYLNKAQQHQEQHGVSWILSLSYHDLPYYLKPCFLYLGFYPEDTEIHNGVLIQLWIAEGFVQQNEQGATKEEIGEEYLLELINRSMVQVGRRSFRGKVKTCRLHDLMRDLCLWKAKEENFLCTFDSGSLVGDPSSSISIMESISNHRMRRHAIHFTQDRYMSMQQCAINPHHRALSLWKPSDSSEPIVISRLVCKKFNFLRVLALEGVMIDNLPRSIGELIHLRYLKLVMYRGIKVPVSIGNLRSLQFLTLKNIKRLPNMLWKMKHLIFCRCHITHGSAVLTHDHKPLRVDGLKNLSTLGLPWGKELPRKFALPELKNLRKLQLYDIDGTDCKSLHQFPIYRLDHLQCLGLQFLSRSCPSQDYDWSAVSCCNSLWKLYLAGRLKKLLKAEEFPPNLTKLVLTMSMLEEDPIPTLEMLPKLESLTLCYATNYKTTKYYFSTKGFGRLQYLRLVNLSYMAELEVENGALPFLVHLEIRSCKCLGMLPEGLIFITSLKKLEVTDMPDEFNKRLPQDGDDWHKIQHIPSIIIRST